MPVFQLRHGTARTIRMQVLAGLVSAVRDHVIARGYGTMLQSGSQVPYSYGEKREGSAQVARKREHKFSVGERQPSEKT